MSKIPKIIHFFHDKETKPYVITNEINFRMCYCSWQRYLGDYTIMHWHDKMPEFQQMLSESEFLRLSYKYKIWAFVSDYVRNWVLYKYGGIYLDTDVEIIKNLDEFLENDFFISTLGDTNLRDENVEPAIMGGTKGHIVFKKMLEKYRDNEIMQRDDKHIVILPLMQEVLNDLSQYRDNKLNLEMEKYQEVTLDEYLSAPIFFSNDKKITIYPPRYFVPAWKRFGFDAITNDTCSIHWEKGSWWRARINFAILMKEFSIKNSKGLRKYIRLFDLMSFKVINKLLRRYK